MIRQLRSGSNFPWLETDVLASFQYTSTIREIGPRNCANAGHEGRQGEQLGLLQVVRILVVEAPRLHSDCFVSQRGGKAPVRRLVDAAAEQ